MFFHLKILFFHSNNSIFNLVDDCDFSRGLQVTETHRKTPSLCHFLVKLHSIWSPGSLLLSRVRCRVNTSPAERCITLSSLPLPSVSLTEDGLRAMLKENQESQGDVSEEDWNAFEVRGNAERLMGKETGRSGSVLTCLFAFKHESSPPKKSVDLRRESRSFYL